MSRTTLNLDQKSYTNKDFIQVYPELLELAKSLAYKWDPTISNESDPGVVLIKELALAIDKINYNTDKAALEQFPQTVQQNAVAQELFKLLGYYPKLYESCTETLSLQYIGDDVEGDSLILPRFTQVKTDEGDLVYSTTEEIRIQLEKGTTASVEIVEGAINLLQVSGSTEITYDMLDSDYRIFFGESNIAQNGIYIYNISNTSNRWKQVDNIELEDVNTLCYQFGLDSLTNQYYIEFPDWIQSIIQSGLYIYYCTSYGTEGQASINTLTNFSSEVECKTVLGNTIALTEDNITISNSALLSYGKDPETITEMYSGYKKTCGTFDTLVTLRDYENAVYLTERVSNAKVCDRTNDPQLSYKVQNETEVYTVREQEAIEEGSTTLIDKILPYEIKLYTFQYYTPVNNKLAYDITFSMPDKNELDSVLLDEIEENQILSVDYKLLENERMCLFTNLYSIKGQIYTNKSLTSTQRSELTQAVQKSLYQTYNGRLMDFGEEVNRDSIMKTIKAADNRIVSLYMEDLSYQTYVQYYNSDGELKVICISDQCSDYIKATNISQTECTINGTVTHYTKLPVYTYILATDSKTTYCSGTIFRVSTTGIEEYAGEYNSTGKSVRDTFREEIIAKCILAGVTPYFKRTTEDFNYYMGESSQEIIPGVETVTTNKELDISLITGEFTVSKNNVLQFMRPSLQEVAKYSVYVKYEFISPYRSSIVESEDYVLNKGEYLTCIWTTSDSNYYYARTYTEGSIICPDFSLSRSYTNWNTACKTRDPKLVTSYPDNYQIDSDIISVDLSVLNKLSTDQTITIKDYLRYELTSDNFIYIISNTKTDDDDQYKITLDENGQYVLNNNETLFFTDYKKTYLKYVGSGTKIISTPNLVLQNPVVSAYRITLLGIKAFEDSDWGSYKTDIELQEQEYINLPEDTKVTVNMQMPLSESSLRISSDGVEIINPKDVYNTYFSSNLIKIGTGYVSSTIKSFIENLYKDTAVNTHFGNVIITAQIRQYTISGEDTSVNCWVFTDLEGNEIVMSDSEDMATSERPWIRTYFNFNNPQSGTTYQYLAGQQVQLKYVIVSSNLKDLSLIQSIDYTLPSGETGSIIPGEQSWTMKAFLNINCSKDEPQYLQDSESITVLGETIEGPAYIETDLDVQQDGGENISVVQLNESTGLYDTVSLRHYEYNPTEVSTENVSSVMKELFTVDANVSTITKETSTTTNLSPGQYILRLYHKCSDLDNFTIWMQKGEEDYIQLQEYNTGVKNLNEAGIYYISIPITANNSEYNFKVIYTRNSSSSKVKESIDYTPLIKVEKNSDIITSSVDTIIKELDLYNDYNYLNEVSDDKLIENPVDSSSFINKNHPFNPFTICQINTYNMQVLT